MKLNFASSLSTASTILGISILSGLGLRLLLTIIPGYLGDQIAWGILADKILIRGVPNVYALVMSRTELGIYPPLYNYMLAIMGIGYRHFYSPSFANPSFTLNVLLKLPPILGDCLVGLLIYIGVRQLAGEKYAIGAMLAYMFNPAIIYNSAYWGMFGDSIYTLCVLLSLVAICSNKPSLAWIAIVAGVSIKPQAIAFVPIVLWATFRVTTLPRLIWAGIIGIVTLGVIWSPFILAGTVNEASSALRQTVGLLPYLSANAHNFWYLFSQGNFWASDATPLIGPLTARTIGLGAFGLVYLFLLYTLSRKPFSGKDLFSGAAYIAFAFFILSTEMHENYIFPTVSLLAFIFWHSKSLKIFALVITITALANMALQDTLLQPEYWLPLTTVAKLRFLNSGINVTVFFLWTYTIVRGAYFPRTNQRILNLTV